MSTFEHWYYATHYRDELDLIFTGWFVWICDDELIDRQNRSSMPCERKRKVSQ